MILVPLKLACFTISFPDFADQMEKARGVGLLKKFEVGRCSEATMSDAFKKQSSILRYLGSIDPTGEVSLVSYVFFVFTLWLKKEA